MSTNNSDVEFEQYATVIVKDLQCPGVVDVFRPNPPTCAIKQELIGSILPAARRHVQNRETCELTEQQAMLHALATGFLEARDEGSQQEMELLALAMTDVIGSRLLMIIEDGPVLEMVLSLNSDDDAALAGTMMASGLANLTPLDLAQI